MLPLAIIWRISRKMAKAVVGGPAAVVNVALEMEKSRERSLDSGINRAHNWPDRGW